MTALADLVSLVSASVRDQGEQGPSSRPGCSSAICEPWSGDRMSLIQVSVTTDERGTRVWPTKSCVRKDLVA